MAKKKSVVPTQESGVPIQEETDQAEISPPELIADWYKLKESYLYSVEMMRRQASRMNTLREMLQRHFQISVPAVGVDPGFPRPPEEHDGGIVDVRGEETFVPPPQRPAVEFTATQPLAVDTEMADGSGADFFGNITAKLNSITRGMK